MYPLVPFRGTLSRISSWCWPYITKNNKDETTSPLTDNCFSFAISWYEI